MLKCRFKGQDHYFIFIYSMNSQEVPEYLNDMHEQQNDTVRLQSFTFSAPNPTDNPETATHTQINSQKHKYQQQYKNTEKDTETTEIIQARVNKSKQQHRNGELTPSRKQSTSLTPNCKATVAKNRQKEHSEQHNSEDEGTGYKDLTKKLETALNKISTAKKLSKTASQNETVWRRLEECAERKKRELQLKQKQSERLKAKHYKEKPTINKQSQKIAKEVGYEPIYTRFEKLMELKKKKEVDIEESKRREKELQEEMFREELNKHMRKPDNIRSYDEYFEEMVRWKEKNNKINKQKLELQLSKQLEGATFKPLLNSKSKMMVASQNRLPIEQRGLMKKPVKAEYSFAPNLSKKSTR